MYWIPLGSPNSYWIPPRGLNRYWYLHSSSGSYWDTSGVWVQPAEACSDFWEDTSMYKEEDWVRFSIYSSLPSANSLHGAGALANAITLGNSGPFDAVGALAGTPTNLLGTYHSASHAVFHPHYYMGFPVADGSLEGNARLGDSVFYSLVTTSFLALYQSCRWSLQGHICCVHGWCLPSSAISHFMPWGVRYSSN